MEVFGNESDEESFIVPLLIVHKRGRRGKAEISLWAKDYSNVVQSELTPLLEIQIISFGAASILIYLSTPPNYTFYCEDRLLLGQVIMRKRFKE